VSAGGEVIKEKKLVHVQPSEMIDLVLQKQELEKIDEENATMEISII
jgi:hypothetical protein